VNEREIFMAALDRESPDERNRYLDEACGNDRELRRRVDALLRSYADSGSFLERPVLAYEKTLGFNPATDPAGPQPPADDPPDLPDPSSDPISLDFLHPSDSPDSLGRLGQYEIREVVGRGGMGLVLKANDTKLNRIVAVKVLAPELASNPTARKRFVREAQAAAAVSHHHVVTIYAVEEEPLPYLVMEFIDGQSLQEKIDRQGQLELKEILRIGQQIAAGLAAAHGLGIIHRDIKPANILLQNGVERVQITDFGLARAVDDVSITRPGEVAGTPQFMSPEQAQGQRVDSRSDLFSLGSVLYTMCTGRPPFRADTTVAVLRRISDDTARPIREVNPDVPDWLVEIVEWLLCKDPDDRFQTAAEVAELLGRHLAHVQDPGSTPFPGRLPAAERRAGGQALRRRFWFAAAAMLLTLTASLGISEATGVTHLAATVIRIATGEGTLVIEVDDPTVQVSLDGEQLSITGAGLQELKLRPGQYQFQAMKDGQPVKQELVTITRGGRQVLRVTRDPVSKVPPTQEAAERLTFPGAFVVLGPDGMEIRKFDTLADAVTGSSAGDTIEIRGNGPFVSSPVEIRHALWIRAGAGFHPVITGNSNDPPQGRVPLLFARCPVVLEGLEVQCRTKGNCVLNAWAPLSATNCRLANLPGPVAVTTPFDCHLRNCELLAPDAPLAFWLQSDARFVVENCVAVGHINLGDVDVTDQASVQLWGNTILAPFPHETLVLSAFEMAGWDKPDARAARPIQIRALGNVFDTSARMLHFFQNDKLDRHLTPAEAEAFLIRRLQWRGEANLFPMRRTYLAFSLDGQPGSTDRLPALADWNRFWGLSNTGSIEGEIRYQGGDLMVRAQTHLERLVLDDFRLRPDSAGYRAGPDGKDLGADIDLVGPGKAYERWKQTPQYQEWRKDAQELMAGRRPESLGEHADGERGQAESGEPKAETRAPKGK